MPLLELDERPARRRKHFLSNFASWRKTPQTSIVWVMGTEDQNNATQPSNIIHIETMFREPCILPVVTQPFEKRIARLLTDATFEEFPALQNMTSDQIRAFGKLIMNTADDFTLKAEEIANAIMDEKTPV